MALGPLRGRSMKSNRILVLSLAGLFLLAACSSGGTTTTVATNLTTGTTAAPTETTAAPGTTAAAVEGASLVVASTELGDVLTAHGLTLYLFMPDAQGAPTCNDDCAANWPALVGPVNAGDGVDAALLGTATRDDGTVQATYNGWPLYHFAGDSAAGDVNGQGVGENWWVVDPAGEPISS